MTCQSPAGGCQLPGLIALTYQTAPLTGRHRGPGLTVTSTFCRQHADTAAVHVRESGGCIVSREELPPPPDPIQSEPVGLDAVDPPPTPEPARVRAPRRRRTKKAVS